METSVLVKIITDSDLSEDAKQEALKRILGAASVRAEVTSAVPVIIATFGAALLGAAADKGSVLRYAGAIPGVIDVFDKARRKEDASELIIPFATSVAGAAAPALIK